MASSSTCRRRPLQTGFLSAGKLTDAATGTAVDEKQLISWARTNWPKNEKDQHVSFEVGAASRKKRKWCTIRCSRQKSRFVDRVASPHLLQAPESRLKSLGQQSRSRSLCLIFTRRTFLSRLLSTTQLAHARNGAKNYRTRSRKKVSGRRFKTRSVGLVEAETFFCLA